MEHTPTKWISGCLVGLAFLTGCAATTTPRLDETFGDAVNLAKARQTLNPDASRNADPVAGLDGVSSNDAIDRYYKTFKAPPPPTTVFNIGIGGGGGAGK